MINAMTTQEVADGLVALCKQGKFDEASETYYSQDIVSIEPWGEPRETHGMEGVRAKIDWWNQNMEVHNAIVEGPWVNEPMFAVRYEIDVTNKMSGQRETMKEIAIYTVENGKIVNERFF